MGEGSLNLFQFAYYARLSAAHYDLSLHRLHSELKSVFLQLPFLSITIS